MNREQIDKTIKDVIAICKKNGNNIIVKSGEIVKVYADSANNDNLLFECSNSDYNNNYKQLI